MHYQSVAVLCVLIVLKYHEVMHIDRKLLDSCLKLLVKTQIHCLHWHSRLIFLLNFSNLTYKNCVNLLSVRI